MESAPGGKCLGRFTSRLRLTYDPVVALWCYHEESYLKFIWPPLKKCFSQILDTGVYLSLLWSQSRTNVSISLLKHCRKACNFFMFLTPTYKTEVLAVQTVIFLLYLWFLAILNDQSWKFKKQWGNKKLLKFILFFFGTMTYADLRSCISISSWSWILQEDRLKISEGNSFQAFFGLFGKHMVSSPQCGTEICSTFLKQSVLPEWAALASQFLSHTFPWLLQGPFAFSPSFSSSKG